MIDYALIARSNEFYEKRGYKRIESPWLVSEGIINITKPKGVLAHKVVKGDKTKFFVGSGEQSFLALINKGFLPQGAYQTVTPCLRNDDFDDIHTKYFMKNELIVWGDVGDAALQNVINDAFDFMASITGSTRLKTISTADGIDIELDGIEVGSYGIRECSFCRWVYGTGLAEPRFSRMTQWKK